MFSQNAKWLASRSRRSARYVTTIPALVSQQSTAEDGRWLPVPDSRKW